MTGNNTSSLLSLWNRLSPLPGGRWLFSRLLAWKVPYTASIGAQIRELRAGHCRTRLTDRRAVRNHLHSIHAIALTNLGEMTSGLALLSGLPANVRGIVLNITTDYIKKARGTLSAECHCQIPVVNDSMDVTVVSEIRDDRQELVARTATVWRLGPTD